MDTTFGDTAVTDPDIKARMQKRRETWPFHRTRPPVRPLSQLNNPTRSRSAAS